MPQSLLVISSFFARSRSSLPTALPSRLLSRCCVGRPSSAVRCYSAVVALPRGGDSLRILNSARPFSTGPGGLNQQQKEEGKREKSVLVIGGSGFVGGYICQQALAHGYKVYSLSRHGTPPAETGNWIKDVNWLSGDISSEPEGEYKETLQHVSGVISCVGTFGSNEKMERVCGDYNITGMKNAHKLGVPAFVYISAHAYKSSIPSKLAPGYIKGKRKMETALSNVYGNKGTIIQPGMVYEKRRVGKMVLPLNLIGYPLQVLTRVPRIQALSNTPYIGSVLEVVLVPPVSARVIGDAAVGAIEDVLKEKEVSSESARIITVDDMLK